VRPEEYDYFGILKRHLGGDLTKIFNGELIYPRQLEIHLPGNHKRWCNFNCPYCQGILVDRAMSHYEVVAMELLDKLKGRIPYVIFGGTYSEPLLNPYLMSFLALTKKHGSNFGIHTNGSYLLALEEMQGFLTELCRIAEEGDYISVSLDAGSSYTHKRTKRTKREWFPEIIEGLRKALEIRGDRSYPSVRVCYLMTDLTGTEDEIKNIVEVISDLKCDSLRFSIPYDVYGKDFSVVKEYRDKVERPLDAVYRKRLSPFLSKSQKEKPFVFYLPPFHQDVCRMRFKKCIYSYYQITIGADGYVYKCSSTATPTFSMNRLGKVTSDLDEFNRMVLANQDPNFSPETCFKVGARCNRMALECNTKYAELVDE